MGTDRGGSKKRVEFTLAGDCPAVSGVVTAGIFGLDQNPDVNEVVAWELMTLFENEVG